MTTQTALFGAAPSTGTIGELFFALRPTAAAIAQIAALTEQLRTQHQIKAKPTAPERLHLTMNYLGKYAAEDDVVRLACKVAESLTVSPFDVSFDYAWTAPAPSRPFVLSTREENPPLKALHKLLHQSLKAAGLRPESRFKPHVTLLYDRAVNIAATDVPPISWHVQELVLLLSVPKQGHTLLGSWPLR